MPARRRYIVPSTGDYELSSGAPRADDGLASQIVIALRTKRGSCIVAPEFGSRLAQIRKARADIARLARDYVTEALQHLIDRGELRTLTVEATANGGRLDLLISYVDRSGSQRSVPYTSRIG